MKSLILGIALILVGLSPTYSQNDSLSVEDSAKTKNSLIGFPFAFFTPETKWGGGAGALYAFRFKGEPPNSKPSQIQLGFAYTQLKQLLVYFPFQLFVEDAKYFVYGELGYFIYNFNYYGIGTNAVEQNEEVFGIEFPRVRLTALRQVYPNLYLGPRFWYDNIDITEVEDQGLLDLGNVPGRSGGHISGVGLTAIWDSRDIIFFPSNGIFAEFTLLPHNSATGSDFNFLRMEMNAAHYQTVFKKHVLASNLILSKSNGTVPFTQMGLLGGTKRMRGFYEGRFRDRNMWVGQLEYRIPLKWRFGVNFFGAVGDVSPNLDSFQIKNTKAAYGLGLRYMFDLEKKLNIRLDMGFTEEGSNFYVTFGEAF